MEAKTNLKSRLPSRHVTEGPARMRSSLPSRQVFADSVERDALENAAAVVAASGCSSNAALHLTAVAHARGIAFDLFDGAEVFKRTPYIADLKPAGRFVAKDLFKADGVSLLMKTLLDNGFMHGDCMTVAGYGMAENLKTCGPELRPSGRNGQRPQSHGWRADRSGARRRHHRHRCGSGKFGSAIE